MYLHFVQAFLDSSCHSYRLKLHTKSVHILEVMRPKKQSQCMNEFWVMLKTLLKHMLIGLPSETTCEIEFSLLIVCKEKNPGCTWQINDC